jgi:SAM-dependent methyltransferase
VGFEVTAQAYRRFMGRYSEPLAVVFADACSVPTDGSSGLRALDVGCGTGALTRVLVDRLGVDAVGACDPSESFVAAVRSRFPGLDVRAASAEALPYDDSAFERTLAGLVVHFMADPVAGLAEMARVTVPGGVVGATVWDFETGAGPLDVFWRAARTLDPDVRDESGLAGVRAGQLLALFESAGMAGAVPSALSVDVVHPSFEEWWEPFTLGVGPAGDLVQRLSDGDRQALRARCREMLPPAPFTVSAGAWTVTWSKPGASV